MIMVYEIVKKALELIKRYGNRTEVENLSGFAESFKLKNFVVVYTTPFSGAEVLPNQKKYMLDIWYKDKKVLSEYYSNIEELELSGHSKRVSWATEFLELN